MIMRKDWRDSPPFGSIWLPWNGRPTDSFSMLILRSLASLSLAILLTSVGAESARGANQPNILWIVSEDNGPYLGCYGDPVARTPNIDRLASQGVRYLNCFSNAAVCAPARQTLISGVYATSLGGQHMRSKVVFPDGIEFFSSYFRKDGYYTSNNSKTDYNGGPADAKRAMKDAWDESGGKAHWRKRPQGKPFFSVFNFNDSHESQLFPNRWKNRELKTDPATVKLPAYLPDLPETRRDLARYYDCLERVDQKVGRVLAELDADGLTEDTIVFYYGDHGGSMPRGKSFTYDSGTRVPLIVRFPEKWKRLSPLRAGGETDRLVSFVDFAATVLSIAEAEIPDYMQGRAFLGKRAAPAREFVHTFRGRRGERYDIVRGVRSKEFLYLRNYTPHLPVMQFNGYSFEIPGYLAWRDAWRRGECNPTQAQWFEPKASEELYRIADDPDNVRNLASEPRFAGALARLRAENDHHLLAIRDCVFYPEGMTGRKWAAYQDDAVYPLGELIELANAVSKRDKSRLPDFEKAMQSQKKCVRYWGVTGCVVLGEQARPLRDSLVARLKDEEPIVRLQAARALAGMGEIEQAVPVIRRFLKNPSAELSLQAALAIDECELVKSEPSLRNALKNAKGQYAARIVKKLNDESRAARERK